MLISSYALLTLEADNWKFKQAYPFVAINLVDSAPFICAAGLAYGLFGTLNFAEIAMRAREISDDDREVCLWDLRWVKMTWIVAGLTVIPAGIGAGAEGFMQLTMKAAERALDQDSYAAAVFQHLGKGATP